MTDMAVVAGLCDSAVPALAISISAALPGASDEATVEVETSVRRTYATFAMEEMLMSNQVPFQECCLKRWQR